MAEEHQKMYEETTETNSETTEIKTNRCFFIWLKRSKRVEDFSHKVTSYEVVSDSKVEEKEEGAKKNTSLLEKLHRSDSSSSSSSEEEVDGDKRKKKKEKKEDTSLPVEKVEVVDGMTAASTKKGFLDKVKEKLLGQKKTDDVTIPPPVVVAPVVE